MPKKGKFGSSIKFESEMPEEKNSFKNAKQRSSARPISPKGPNNQQSPFVTTQDGPRPHIIEPVILTQRYSLTNEMKSPMNARTPSINQKHVNMVVEQSFASLPKKIVLPPKR
jgi:hypothetical protein